TIGEKVYFSETWFEGESALGTLGHDWQVQYDYESGVPSHNFEFEVKATYTCKICGESHKDVVKVEPIMHTWSEEPVYVPDLDYTDPNVKTDDDGYVVFNEKGEAVLINNSKDGHYEARWYCTDKNCAAERREELDEGPAYKFKDEIEYAKTGVYAKIVNYDKEHIVSNLINGRKYYNPTQQLPLDEDDIELEDCRIGGWYEIAYFADQGTPEDDSDDTPLSKH